MGITRIVLTLLGACHSLPRPLLSPAAAQRGSAVKVAGSWPAVSRQVTPQTDSVSPEPLTQLHHSHVRQPNQIAACRAVTLWGRTGQGGYTKHSRRGGDRNSAVLLAHNGWPFKITFKNKRCPSGNKSTACAASPSPHHLLSPGVLMYLLLQPRRSPPPPPSLKLSLAVGLLVLLFRHTRRRRPHSPSLLGVCVCGPKPHTAPSQFLAFS